MIKDEMLAALDEGHKVTHHYFTPEEFIEKNPEGDGYIFEDGYKCCMKEFFKIRSDKEWETGWSIYNEK